MSHNPGRLLAFPDPDHLTLSIRAKALVFSDPRSQHLLERIERVAATEATVLIIGETGTGKELVARHIHEHSGRKGPFVAVNCGAFNETLVEAELFGHESGAFTGAQQARAGWFEAANGGTLFLDEIGDLPLSLQVRLLRVLQERQVVRIGSRKPVPLDVRLVAATNIELEKAVNAGHFRLDLYYRLNVAQLRLPPLRERRGDILPLAHHFIERYRAKLHLDDARVTPAAAQALTAYDWPGNIRELENVVHFGLIMCHDGVLDVGDLRLPGFARKAAGRDAGVADDPLQGLQEALGRLLASEHEPVYETVERLLVTSAFHHCDDNQVRSAKRLGISRNILRAQLKRFGLLDGGVAEFADAHDAAYP
ncbi:sigma-54 dependent transcriptional regulator [Azoarcus sp. DN11]|uniref:sigma-54 interaction domain-containing protein n=1 Tax=Azoarcus sp. DN11 TaxID=356837 RepID=UPI000EACECA4|nr:sigma-54 dependent transcriptional regulator [Azoarcus sp. DN11]AYH42907.1 Fis family transcriptional regulator [Azoarcus sp. DN11]